jgi:hypothetical protein
LPEDVKPSRPGAAPPFAALRAEGEMEGCDDVVKSLLGSDRGAALRECGYAQSFGLTAKHRFQRPFNSSASVLGCALKNWPNSSAIAWA